MLERTAISEEERTIDGSQDSILETSGDLEEGTSPSSMAQSQRKHLDFPISSKLSR